jgi:hypothetical protein
MYVFILHYKGQIVKINIILPFFFENNGQNTIILNSF